MSEARDRSTTHPLNKEYNNFDTRRRGSLPVRSNRVDLRAKSVNAKEDVIAESYHVGLGRLPSEAGSREHKKDYASPPSPEEKGEVVVLIRGNDFFGEKIPSNLHRGATNHDVRRGSYPVNKRQDQQSGSPLGGFAFDTRRRGSLPVYDSNSFGNSSFSVSRGLGSVFMIRSVDEEDERFQDKLQQVRYQFLEVISAHVFLLRRREVYFLVI